MYFIFLSSFKKKEWDKIEIAWLNDSENVESKSGIDFQLLHERSLNWKVSERKSFKFILKDHGLIR